MITELTPEQQQMLPAIRDAWLAHGLSTKPADRPAAEAGVRQAYAAAGLRPPRFMIWLDSPWAGVIGQAIAPAIVTEALRQARASCGGQVDGQVRGQVDGQVDGQVYGQVYRQVYRENLSNWWRGLMYGQHNAGYYSWLDAMEHIGVTGLEPIHGQQQVARNAGWWWCHADFAILTERPRELHRDPAGALHCETGPAISYPDGWAIHAWHGTRVPADLIEGDGWTVERILTEPNSEIRRCAIERLGWDRFIADAKLTPVGPAVPDTDPAAGFTATQLYRPDSIYAITPCTEDTARRAAGIGRVAPVQAWELPAAKKDDVDDNYIDYGDDDNDGDPF